MRDDFLGKYYAEPRREFGSTLYTRLNEQPQRQLSSLLGFSLRPKLVFALSLALLAGTLVLSPSARAAAASLVYKIGGISLSNQDVSVPPPAENAAVVTGPTATPLPVSVLSAEEAGEQIGFPVYTPAYVPADYTLEYRTMPPGPSGKRVVTIYDNKVTEAWDILQIDQFQFAPGDPSFEWFIGDAPLTQVTVRGQTGVWVDRSAEDVAGLNSSLLLWEEQGFTFVLHNPVLSLEEMLKIAESLELQ